ncbi:CLUMA_CG020606, isoform A [Clunio marinus]|uniref:CLUMA_CG020606, isoform A n=1 Tax=Clunio marinus TaxID=568069 RepID=A0A1J1J6N4_9DIPT|nr:CLUMA_CG020606, isoform A [Clunio marinus]
MLISIFMTKCVLSSIYPPYSRFDAYMRAWDSIGKLSMLKEYDRIADVLHELRDIDFGVNPGYKASPPDYKGCDPMQRGKHPVKCKNVMDKLNAV